MVLTVNRFGIWATSGSASASMGVSPATALAMRGDAPLGLRLLNPLLVERSGDVVWQGQSRRQRHRRFVSFEQPVFGIRCAAIVLLNYEKRGINTPRKIVQTWAPANENDVGAYVDHITKISKIPANMPIHLRNSPAELGALIEAMAWYEIGVQLPWYPTPREPGRSCLIVMAGIHLAYSQWQPKPHRDIYTAI